MFMDPSAFEADDIERELADAGLEPDKDLTRYPSGGDGQRDDTLGGNGATSSALSKDSNRGYGVDTGPASCIAESQRGVGNARDEDNRRSIPRSVVGDGLKPAPVHMRHRKGIQLHCRYQRYVENYSCNI